MRKAEEIIGKEARQRRREKRRGKKWREKEMKEQGGDTGGHKTNEQTYWLIHFNMVSSSLFIVLCSYTSQHSTSGFNFVNYVNTG